MRFLIAFLIALVVGSDSQADEPRIIVENKTPPPVIVVNKARIVAAPAAPAVATTVVCGPTGCQTVSVPAGPPAGSASAPPVLFAASQDGAVGVSGIFFRSQWWVGQRLGRPKPLYRR